MVYFFPPKNAKEKQNYYYYEILIYFRKEVCVIVPIRLTRDMGTKLSDLTRPSGKTGAGWRTERWFYCYAVTIQFILSTREKDAFQCTTVLLT